MNTFQHRPSNRTSWKIISIVVGVALVMVTATSVIFAGPNQNAPTPHEMDVSWAYRYSSLTNLSQSADLIVYGTITNHTKTNTDPVTGITQSYFTFRIITVIKPAGSSLASINITQTGGTSKNGTLYQITDDPLMNQGNTLVLFLMKGTPPSLYHIAGGPQGRFVVESGKVYSLDVLFPNQVNEQLPASINGQSVADFLHTITTDLGAA